MEINYIKLANNDIKIEVQVYYVDFKGLQLKKIWNEIEDVYMLNYDREYEEVSFRDYYYYESPEWMTEYEQYKGLLYVTEYYILKFIGEVYTNQTSELTKVFNYSKADEFAEILNRLDYNIFVISADDFRGLEESFDNKNPANKVKTKKFCNLDYDFDDLDLKSIEVASLIEYYKLLEGTRYVRYDTNLFIISTKPIEMY